MLIQQAGITAIIAISIPNIITVFIAIVVITISIPNIITVFIAITQNHIMNIEQMDCT